MNCNEYGAFHVKGRVQLLMELHLTAAGCCLPYTVLPALVPK